jgi:hypothetical protein
MDNNGGKLLLSQLNSSSLSSAKLVDAPQLDAITWF